jgi:HSP20 family molecular chaperone IbpA
MSTGKTLITTLDVTNYRPEEISLRVENRKIYVDGKHHSEGKYGSETSEFHRVFSLPEGVEPSSVSSRITHDGVLHVEAFKAPPKDLDIALLGCSSQDVSRTDDKKFAVTLNVSDYSPEEVQVKVKGNELSVHAAREKEEGGVSSSREFHRHFLLPKDVDMARVVSRIDKKGQLHIEAPRKEQPASNGERQLFILRD